MIIPHTLNLCLDEGALKAVLPPDPETILGKKVIPDIIDAVVESIEVADTIQTDKP